MGHGLGFVQHGFGTAEVLAGEDVADVEGDIILAGLGGHGVDKGDEAELLRALAIFPKHLEVLAEVEAGLLRPVGPLLVEQLRRFRIDAEHGLVRHGRPEGQDVGNDEPAHAARRQPGHQGRQFGHVVAHEHEFRPDLQVRSRMVLLGRLQGQERPLDMPQGTAAPDGVEELRGCRVHGQEDPIQSGLKEGSPPGRVEEMAVGLEPDPTAFGHGLLGAADAGFQAGVEERFPDAV